MAVVVLLLRIFSLKICLDNDNDSGNDDDDDDEDADDFASADDGADDA